MSERWSNAQVLTDFGGEYTLSGVEQAVPPTHSARVRNCLVYPGRVTQRPGWQQAASLGTTITSMGEFIPQSSLTRYLMILCSDGSLRRLDTSYSSTTVAAAGDLFQSSQTTMRAKFKTLFGRSFMGFTQTGYYGESKPMAYDGTSLIPVGAGGPGESGNVADSASAGSISAGTHTMRVLFTTKWGYLTAPGPAVTWTAAGSKKADVTNIPVGPSYVDGRILCFSAAADTDLYYIAGTSMVVADNTTTSVSGIDFTDTQLISAVPVSVASDPDSDLLRLIELPAMKWVGAYHRRLCWIGERSNLTVIGDVGFRALNFNGGFSGNRPLGWTEKIAGESKGSGLTGANGDYLTITGNGAAVRGLLANKGLAFNTLSTAGTPHGPGHRPPGGDDRVGIIPANKAVYYRIRLRKENLSSGRLYLFMANTTDGNATLPANYVEIDQANMSSTEWTILEGQIHPGFNGASAQELRICAGKPDTSTNLFVNNGKCHIDYIEICLQDAKWGSSLVRWSDADAPDVYDGLTGYQVVNPDDGERLMLGFELNDAWYYIKERSMWVTRDNGSSEPADWTINNVSRVVGSPYQQGVAYGDRWVAIASELGLYYFDGGRPVCLSDDLRATWDDAVNNSGEMSVFVDNRRCLILVSCALTGDTGFPRHVMVFQWYGDTPVGGGIRCGVWALPSGVTVMQFAEWFPSGRDVVFCGFGTGNRILKLTDGSHDDWGNAIAQEYRTPYIGPNAARGLLKGARVSIRGSGNATVTSVFPDETTSVTHDTALALPATAISDKEYPFLRHVADRAALDFSTNAVGAWFSLEKMAAVMVEKPMLPQRGRR